MDTEKIEKPRRKVGRPPIKDYESEAARRKYHNDKYYAKQKAARALYKNIQKQLQK